jgi:16S rRNA (guanine527-N7)-methyltransferase
MAPLQTLPTLEDIWLKTLGWQPTPQQQAQFEQVYQEILAGNRRLNLTRITEPLEFWEKHLWDSLAGLVGLGLADIVAGAQALQAIDIGTGAGFPGIPLAIALPFWTVTLVDSTRKKIQFIEHLIPQLDSKNIKTLTARIEDLGQQSLYREAYDLACIRAVGEAKVGAEYALPLLKIGGLAILYRGHWSPQETSSLEPVVTQLGGQIESVVDLTTPLSHSIRHWIYVRKVAATPRLEIKRQKSKGN